MKTHTKFLGLTITTLAGVLVGLWLAAETWRPLDGAAGVPHPGANGEREALDGTGRPLCPLAGDTPADGAWSRPVFVASDDGSRAGAETVALEPLVREPGRAHARPTPNPKDPRFTPGEDDVCLAVRCEDASGNVPAGARVAVFAFEDGAPRLPVNAQASFGYEGLAYARAIGTTDMFVVAFAPGCVPETRRVHAQAGTRVELDPFVFTRGETIHGRVTAGGDPLARAQIDVEARATSLTIDVEGGPLGWRQGRFVWARAVGESRADGTYDVGGLEPGDYTVWITTVRQRDAAIDVSLVPKRRASASAQDVDFALPGAWLELSFQADQRPLCCVEVQIQAGDRQFMRTTDERGRIAMRIQPAVAYPVVAARSGYSTRRVDLLGMSDGEHGARTIELEPQKLLATLEVDDQGTAGPGEATFRFHPRFAAVGQPDFERSAERDRATGLYLLPALPSGSWTMTMVSGRRFRDMTAITRSADDGINANCDATAQVTVPEAGTQRVKLSVSSRGYLAVTARMASGTRVQADCALVDLRGEPIESVTVGARVPDFQMPIQNGTIQIDAPMYVYSALCGGYADLLVTRDDCEPSRTRVSLVPGGVTPVDVILRPR